MKELWTQRGVLLAATGTTVEIFACSALLALAISFVAGIAAVSSNKWARPAALIYGELFRGVSLVVQLFWLFFVLPLFGLTISATQAAVYSLGLCFGAYGAETVRTALLALPKGQRHAAQALGLTRYQSFVHVELPQAVPILVAPLGNLLVLIIKSTSVTALVTVPELSFVSNALSANLGVSFAVFIYVIAVYYALAHCVLSLTARIEKRMRAGLHIEQSS
ncbi:amino acid ABC transporter permease [Caballeronia sp. AZ7_KS35]|uniref:amino acid ABC transporter permease n=1 Tax=Caballeronia sp. AZ7_KS35 TaxID=2921762 RepID=UPI002027F433|nr:amino acid ABC transporter permease [Caballeronia sp. AZ7_KS35]